MTKKDKLNRDPFALSLGGLTVANAYMAVPVIAHDRLQKKPAGQAGETRMPRWRLWIPRRLRVV